MSVDKKSGTKLFAVSAYKSLNRKQSYVIALDFKKATVNFHKVKRGKEVKKIFPFTQCVKLEKDKKDTKMLSLTFGNYTDAAYKKTIYFDCQEDREQFCNLVHAAIVIGTKAYALFSELDVHGKGELLPKEMKGSLTFDAASTPTKPLDFCAFLLAYSAQQTRLGPQAGMSGTAAAGSGGESKTAASASAGNSIKGVPAGSTSGNSLKMMQSGDNKAQSKEAALAMAQLMASGGTASAGNGTAAAGTSAAAGAVGSSADMIGLRLLDGEAIIVRQQHTSRLDSLPPQCTSSRGTLFLTNYRLMYRDYNAHSKYDMTTEFPLTYLSRLSQTGDSTIKLYCKDYRVLSFGFDASKSWVDGLLKHVSRMAFPKDQTKLFAFSHRLPASVEKNPVLNGWDLYNPVKEYDRIGLLSAKDFKLVQDLDFKLSPTYPSMFVVPKDITDEEIREVCAYRSRGRLPAVTWQHPTTLATISRSSQPNVGLSGKRCEADEKLIQRLREVNPTNKDTLYIMDARPYKAAVGNTVMGKGFENISHYDKCQLHFMGITNIHGIRESLDSLMDLCNTSGESKTYDDVTFLHKLQETQWLMYLRIILQSGSRIAQVLDEEGASVLTHCSDGWDRTAQLVSIAELLLDPYYRTIEGFAVLIEKDWLAFGHKFSERCGHGDPDFAHDQRAPIFLQFIDVVYQIWRQFPLSFEFNESFLLEVVAQVPACRFGTFLFDNLRERRERSLRSNTVSVWSSLLSPENRFKYINVFYVHTGQSAAERRRLIPSTVAKSIVLWERLHMRHDKAGAQESMDVGAYLMATRYQQLRQNVIDAGLDINKLDTPTTINSIILGAASTGGGTAGSGGVLLDTPDDHRAPPKLAASTSQTAGTTAAGPGAKLTAPSIVITGASTAGKVIPGPPPRQASGGNVGSAPSSPLPTATPTGTAAKGTPAALAAALNASAAKPAAAKSNTLAVSVPTHRSTPSEPNTPQPLPAYDLDSSPDNSPGNSPPDSPRSSGNGAGDGGGSDNWASLSSSKPQLPPVSNPTAASAAAAGTTTAPAPATTTTLVKQNSQPTATTPPTTVTSISAAANGVIAGLPAIPKLPPTPTSQQMGSASASAAALIASRPLPQPSISTPASPTAHNALKPPPALSPPPVPATVNGAAAAAAKRGVGGTVLPAPPASLYASTTPPASASTGAGTGTLSPPAALGGAKPVVAPPPPPPARKSGPATATTPKAGGSGQFEMRLPAPPGSLYSAAENK